jgi:3-oxoacyl-[acyl-carrier protein] reductase
MPSIRNQVAVVTGAGSGIGKAIAIELGRIGAKVALAARSRPELEETGRIIGSSASVIPANVRKKEDVHQLLDLASSSLGPIDILVNAAGVGIFGPVADFTDEDFATLIETNLRSIFYACRYVLPSMMERRTGHIINIASIAGKVGSANRAAYCASKFGVVGFTESLAEEARQYGVRAAVVCPGSTDTAFSGDNKTGSRERMLRPEDVARVVAMMVTEEQNSFISEVVLRPVRKP